MEVFTTLITNVGFPIACVAVLGWFVYKVWISSVDDAKQREEKYSQQIDKFGDMLNKFNETLIRIDSRLEQLEKKIDK